MAGSIRWFVHNPIAANLSRSPPDCCGAGCRCRMLLMGFDGVPVHAARPLCERPQACPQRGLPAWPYH